MKASYILVCSPMRTGSTYVYNFFNECVSGVTVKKYEHSPMNFLVGTDFAPIIFRHPVACIGSLIEYFNETYNLDSITKHYNFIKPQYEWAKQLLVEFPNCAVELRYENFFNNIDFLVDWTRINLEYEIHSNILEKFTTKFNLNNIKIMSDNNLNLFQPNHISSGKGNNKEKIEKVFRTKLLYRELSKFSRDYGYEY